MSSNTVDWFFANTRGKVDQSYVTENTYANEAALGRQTSYFGGGDCTGALSPASAMADQPGMIARGGYGLGAGCEIDVSTDLRTGDETGIRVKGPKQLWVRPFSTTPNLGQGREADAVNDESYLLRSSLPRMKKEASTIMDKTIPNYYQPLIPIKESDFHNTNNWVQSWTWGGDSSRLIKKTRVDGST